MSYLGKSECGLCGAEVDVSLNRSGMAYYRCGPCGFKGEATRERGNRMLNAKTRRFADPDEAPEPGAPAAPEPRESREITEPKPESAPAAKRRASLGFFSGT